MKWYVWLSLQGEIMAVAWAGTREHFYLWLSLSAIVASIVALIVRQ